MSEWIIDGILTAGYVILTLALIIMLVSLALSVCRRNTALAKVKGLPSASIAVASVSFLVVVLVVTFLFSSSNTLVVNGKEYADWLWLKISDMFIGTIVVMTLLAVLFISIGGIIVRRR